MNDKEILDEINELIVEEDGNAIEADQLFIESDIDSFGLTMVIITLDDKYRIWTPVELENLDFTILTPIHVIEKMRSNDDS